MENADDFEKMTDEELKDRLKQKRQEKKQRKKKRNTTGGTADEIINWGDHLPWQASEVDPDLIGFENAGYFGGLEEVDGSVLELPGSKIVSQASDDAPDPEFQEALGMGKDGKKKKTKVGSKKRRAMKGLTASDKVPKAPWMDTGVDEVDVPAAPVEEGPPDMSAWEPLGLHPSIIAGLATLRFTTPTPIQASAVPSATVARRDLICTAETGSGKTLAFGLPILHRILTDRAAEAAKASKGEADDAASADPDEEAIDSTGANDEDGDGSTEAAAVVEASEECDADADEEIEGAGPGAEEEEEEEDAGESAGEDEGCDEAEEDADDDQDEGGMEVVQRLALGKSKKKAAPGSGPKALILTPTRELAIQVRDHIHAVAKTCGIKVIAIVGGLAPQKQERLLSRRPEVVVATPGRLWAIMQQGDSYLSDLTSLSFFVLDEADRMVAAGHYAELDKIIAAMDKNATETYDFEAVAAAAGQPVPANAGDEARRAKLRRKRQLFVFSATLGITPEARMKAKAGKHADTDVAMERLMAKLQFHRPKTIDLTRASVTAAGLKERKVVCVKDQKDLYLYYLLYSHPGRTLVFVNSIACLRRLVPLLTNLGFHVFPLHAQMQQRQRLKNLDRLKTDPQAVLVASDVAARGLDIPAVDHVIHYQLPPNSELYVHRSGRTARASAAGLSVMFVGPEDTSTYRKICSVLNKEEGIEDCEVDMRFFGEMRKRMELARDIDQLTHRLQKTKSEKDWYQKNAAAMEIELDEDLIANEKEERETAQRADMRRDIAQKRQSLVALLQKPLAPKGKKFAPNNNNKDASKFLKIRPLHSTAAHTSPLGATTPPAAPIAQDDKEDVHVPATATGAASKGQKAGKGRKRKRERTQGSAGAKTPVVGDDSATTAATDAVADGERTKLQAPPRKKRRKGFTGFQES